MNRRQVCRRDRSLDRPYRCYRRERLGSSKDTRVGKTCRLDGNDIALLTRQNLVREILISHIYHTNLNIGTLRVD